MCCWTLAHLLRSGLVYQFVVFANFTCATYLSAFEAPCCSHTDIYIGHWNRCHTSLLFYSCNFVLLAVSTLAPQRVAVFGSFVVFANFTCATYLSVFEAPCFSHADIYIGHWNCCHTSLLFFLRFGGSQLLFHLARRQIKRAGLSRYTSLSDLHQKNDGRTCFGARGVVTLSRAGAPSRRGWGGFCAQRGP